LGSISDEEVEKKDFIVKLFEHQGLNHE